MSWLPKNRNTRLLAICATVAVSMVGAAYAAVPLYDLFCRVTGYGGTTQVGVAAADRVLDREVTVRFDASRNAGLPWEFQPIDRAITVNVGESALAYYRATNTSDRPITGVATYNVTPFKAAPYFVKLECFCFTEQTLQPGESIDMPVLFFVDPEIENDRRADDITTITLSYTFFEAETSEPGATSGRDTAP
ncbi:MULTISPECIES: cytochrome c oxidase assembly protein [Hyphobacterium]|uniref:Cytochrome c oxidase assembly protein CtaG n=1 Tax=Hyphobacterium vulgare TaxID=1736751 RepID=A0ABV6ZYL5_9PROT